MILKVASLLLIVPTGEAELGWGTETIAWESVMQWETGKKHCWGSGEETKHGWDKKDKNCGYHRCDRVFPAYNTTLLENSKQ